MNRGSFDFDVITGPAVRPVPKPPAKPAADQQKPTPEQDATGGK
jgi:hypothetical protein